jgi:hypothetical protein
MTDHRYWSVQKATVAADLVALQRQLLARFDAHPPSSWAPDLLRAVIAVIDLRPESAPVVGRRVEAAPCRPTLRLVK